MDIIFQNVLRDSTDAKSLKDQLEEHKISPQEYNDAMLSLFFCDFSGKVPELTAGLPIGYESAIQSENMGFLKTILEEFYKIDHCPSFLYHQAMLEKEDYGFAFQIYSQIFEIKNNGEDSMHIWTKGMFEEYTKDLLQDFSTCANEDDFLQKLQKNS